MRADGSSGPRRLTLAVALLSSLLLHLLLVGGGLPLTGLFAFDDDLLSSRPPRELPRIRLAAQPPSVTEPAARAGMRVTLMAPPPAGPSRPPAKAQRLVAAAPSSPDPASPTPAPAAGAATAPDGIPPPSPPLAGVVDAAPEAVPLPEPPEDPAPAFPVQLSARLAARIGGIEVPLRQDWWMEGYRYAISISGSRLGVQLQASSVGRLAAEGGLLPERSETMVGGKVRAMTEASGGVIRLGRPGQLREVPLPLAVQDMMSLPIHLAVTFDGAARTHFVSTGHSVQQLRFIPVAEETLRLPAGRLRTLHLRGEYFDQRLREMIPVVDVWLAIDYLNVPVKVSGHLNDGQPFEYRLDALEIEGLVVLDSKRPGLAQDSDDAIPDWLQARRAQGLKYP